MRQDRSSRTALVVALSATIVGLALTALFAAIGTAASSNGAAGHFEWLVALVAGVLIGAVTLILLESRQSARGDEDSSLASAECPACGNPILEEWRLCPHCGELLQCDTRPAGMRIPDLRNT